MSLFARPFSRAIGFAFLSALTVAGCGTVEDALEEAAAEACPTVEGDTHVGAATLADGRKVMLHIDGRECAVVGDNRFVLYPVVETASDDMHAMAVEPAHVPMERDNEALVVEDVVATMPSMGHGTAKPATIDDEQPSAFTVPFQMGGDWTIELQFRYAMETTVQTAAFELKVH